MGRRLVVVAIVVAFLVIRPSLEFIRFGVRFLLQGDLPLLRQQSGKTVPISGRFRATIPLIARDEYPRFNYISRSLAPENVSPRTESSCIRRWG